MFLHNDKELFQEVIVSAAEDLDLVVPIVEKEHKGFERFKYALEEAGLIKTAGKFEVKYLSAKQFMDCFQMTNKNVNIKKDILLRSYKCTLLQIRKCLIC